MKRFVRIVHLLSGDGLYSRLDDIPGLRSAAVHSSVHNLFNHDRSLSRRSNFKLNGATALEEWRQLCVA